MAPSQPQDLPQRGLPPCIIAGILAGSVVLDLPGQSDERGGVPQGRGRLACSSARDPEAFPSAFLPCPYRDQSQRDDSTPPRFRLSRHGALGAGLGSSWLSLPGMWILVSTATISDHAMDAERALSGLGLRRPTSAAVAWPSSSRPFPRQAPDR